MLETLQNKTAYLFVAAFAFSFLFIPAFQYGVASVWAILFAIILAFYFDASLRRLLIKYDAVEQGKERCVDSIKEYFLISAKLTILISVAPITATLIAIEPSISMNLDALVMPYISFEAIMRNSFDNAHINLHIINAFSAVALPFMVLVFLLSSKKLMQLSDRIMFLSSEDDPPNRRGHVQVMYHFQTGFALIVMFCLPLILKEVLENMLRTGIVPEFGMSFIILIFSMLLSFFHLLLFIQIVAFKKT